MEEIDRDLWYSANMENWYNDIEDHTFKTIFLPLSIDEAKVMMEAYQESNLNESQKQKMDSIEARIEGAIATFGNTAFVKLSCRSPKDVTLTSETTKQLYEKKMSTITTPTDNDKISALFEAHIKALKVTSAKQALGMLLKSGRINEDLTLGLQDEKTFNIQIIVREWVDVPISHEFRAFVYGKKLNALSQYFDFCFFQDIQSKQSEILKLVSEEFEKIKDKVKLDNYICDFGISSDGKVYIIELNPWLETTDSCLFNWIKDDKLLKNGPLELRVNTKPRGGIKGLVLEPWKHYFEKPKVNK
eukprot:TRINITY_DN6611_c0_g1_i1.p1 TRINITY_DN6611_c0_g1~~TRINITY_DN6611_c0_g1_i1.p1  ORF type:complete len:302 (+),score=71.44 TRINITY_DN6611_c0_g1_i1:97-1002(+)